ncbi:MAG: helix-turn-helix domain-containing protein [Clostridia bacterium]|jgi:plasmid maintenance system antidote protein VapI|nr:helix-turn-helix domain-containing protein [Clostridia bacterium]
MKYENLKSEMARNGITQKDLANLLNIHRNSVYLKINGGASFSVEEAILIREKFFPDLSLKYLFEFKRAK